MGVHILDASKSAAQRRKNVATAAGRGPAIRRKMSPFRGERFPGRRRIIGPPFAQWRPPWGIPIPTCLHTSSSAQRIDCPSLLISVVGCASLREQPFEHQWRRLNINGAADHVHALVRLPAALAVARPSRSKANSSRWIHQYRVLHRRFSWQSG